MENDNDYWHVKMNKLDRLIFIENMKNNVNDIIDAQNLVNYDDISNNTKNIDILKKKVDTFLNKMIAERISAVELSLKEIDHAQAVIAEDFAGRLTTLESHKHVYYTYNIKGDPKTITTGIPIKGNTPPNTVVGSLDNPRKSYPAPDEIRDGKGVVSKPRCEKCGHRGLIRCKTTVWQSVLNFLSSLKDLKITNSEKIKRLEKEIVTKDAIIRDWGVQAFDTKERVKQLEKELKPFLKKKIDDARLDQAAKAVKDFKDDLKPGISNKKKDVLKDD